MAYGHLTGNMLTEVEGFPDAARLVDLIVDTVWFVAVPAWYYISSNFLSNFSPLLILLIPVAASLAMQRMKACSSKSSRRF